MRSSHIGQCLPLWKFHIALLKVSFSEWEQVEVGEVEGMLLLEASTGSFYWKPKKSKRNKSFRREMLNLLIQSKHQQSALLQMQIKMFSACFGWDIKWLRISVSEDAWASLLLLSYFVRRASAAKEAQGAKGASKLLHWPAANAHL